VSMTLAVVSLFVRYRTAGRVERTQLKWLAYAGAFVAIIAPITRPPWARNRFRGPASRFTRFHRDGSDPCRTGVVGLRLSRNEIGPRWEGAVVEIKVGTFNLNNLFSRFNFKAHVDELPPDERDVTVTYEFDEEGDYWFRTFRGRLIQPMPEEQRQALAARITAMDLDVLAVQEVEDIEALKDLGRLHLGGLYANNALIEGNDTRFIDVGLLSKFPIGAVTSWQHETHSAVPSERVFARDLLEVEILDSKRSRRLMTLYVNHLTSQFVEPGESDPQAAAQRKADRRRRQAEKVAEIVERRMRPDSRFVVLGDMNDVPEADTLAPLATSQALNLTNALEDPMETRPAKADVPPPASKAWTHRFKEPHQPASYELFDQIWVSPALASKQSEAWIDRRTKHGGRKRS
jgi:endonuclease/exonuclease/phosphatase family metal-dependent hydrolase